MRLDPRFALSLAAATIAALASGPAAQTQFTAPTPYLSAADTPPLFSGSPTLEDFEDGSLVAGVTASAGFVATPASNTDSVDADDGAIDGCGANGNSWFNSSGAAGVTFTFSEGALGALPTAVGLVWTDGFGDVTFEAFGPDGTTSLGTLGPFSLSDGSFLCGTAEDRFFGVTDPSGIGAVRLSTTDGGNGIEVDHLQFGTQSSGQQVSLFDWTEDDYAGNGSAGNWVVSGDGLSVTQTINGLPTFFISDFDLIDSQFEGSFRVATTSDDDLIGFVFGYQGLASNESFYIFHWKQTPQGTGEEGVKLLRVDGDPNGNEVFDGENSTHVTVLAEQLGSAWGWADHQEYRFFLTYQSNGNIRVIIRNATTGAVFWNSGLVNDPSPIGIGKVGFFNHSQSSVVYAGFTQAALQPPISVAGGPYAFDASQTGVTLDAGASFDPDGALPGFGGIASLQWDVGDDGTADDVGKTNQTEPVPFAEALAKGLAIGVDVPVRLTVTDIDGLTGSNLGQLQYQSAAPTAGAGGPYGPIAPGGSVNLSGSSGDVDLAVGVGEALTFEWDTAAAATAGDLGDGFASTESASGLGYDMLAQLLGTKSGQLHFNVSDAAGLVGTAPADVTLLGPDLTVTEIDAPAIVDDLGMPQVSWTIRNDGDGDALGNWSDQLFLTTDAAGSNPVLLAIEPAAGPLAPGASYTRIVTPSLPPALLGGDYFFQVVTDNGDQVLELEAEGNNATVAPAPTLVVQTVFPDLVVDSITFDAMAFVDEPKTFTFAVGNDSAATASAFGAWRDRVYLSDDAVFDPAPGGTDTLIFEGVAPSGLSIGQSFQHAFATTLPSTPGTYHYFVQADAANEIDEGPGGEGNNSGVHVLVVEQPGYTSTIQADIVEGLAATGASPLTVTLSGQTVDLVSGQPVPNVPLSVRVYNQGTRRVFDMVGPGMPLMSDGNGDWSFPFQPLPGEAGQFDLFADHPATMEDPLSPQAGFVLYGLRVSPSQVFTNLKEGQQKAVQVTLTNLGDTPVMGIQGLVGSAPAWVDLTGLSVPSMLSPLQSASVTYTVDATGLPPSPNDPGVHGVDVTVPVNGSDQVADSFTQTTYVSPLLPVLSFDKSSLNAAMTKGQQTLVTFAVTNTGGAAATDVEVLAPCIPNPGEACPFGTLLTVITPTQIGTLAPDETTVVEIVLAPSNAALLGDYDGSIAIQAAETGKALPFSFEAVSSAMGDFRVRVEDELTYYAMDGTYMSDGSGPLVAGASVKLFKQGTSQIVAEGTTDASGQIVFPGLIEAFYTMKVEAPQHGSENRIVKVQPGQETIETVFLPTQVVTYDWTVVPTEVEDEYEITIEATFETFVPTPKVTVEPTVVDLDIPVGGTIQVDFTLENHGLVTALGTELVLESPPGYEVNALIDVVGALGPLQKITIPATITRLASDAPGDCTTTLVSGVRWYVVCVGEVWYWAPVYFVYPVTTCPGGTPSGGCPPGGCGGSSGPSGGGGPGGTGGTTSFSPFFSPPSYDIDFSCQPPPEQPPDPPPDCPPLSPENCCMGTGGGEDGSGSGGGGAGGMGDGEKTNPVTLSMGEKVESVVDLIIPGRGMDFVWSRRYRSKNGPNTLQGNGWDNSFNLFLDRDGTDVLLCEGTGRTDRYEPQPDGIWTRDEYFREIERMPDGSYEVGFANRGKWMFHPVDGSVMSGKLMGLSDRMGNSMTCLYDAMGRLETILDTLNRPITLAYNGDGFLESVTDFTGRQVSYTYYQDGDPNGSFGDLATVTTPAVVGTPNGNDFLGGKTTVYTYTTGFADERLNHNLLSITDGKGQTYLEMEYHPTLDDNNRQFDRVTRQVWGDAGDITDFVYVPLVPSFQNNQAVLRTILNDRVGNVVEYDWDIMNRLIAKREFTGRADADMPTTLTANRPGAPLRPADPVFFETLFGYNKDSLLTRKTAPNGTITEYVYQGDLDPMTPSKIAGNLVQVRRTPGAHLPVGDQPSLVTTFEYAPDAGTCCGTDWVTKEISADGAETEHEYDANGNRTKTIYAEPGVVEDWEYNGFGQITAHVWPADDGGLRQRDEFVYYASGPNEGWLQQLVEDVGGLNLITQFEYDAVGNLVREIDPRGNDTLRTWNELNQLVREESKEVDLGGNAVRYVKDQFYDERNDLVRVEVQNLDSQGVVDATHPVIVTTHDYGILGELIRTTRDISSTDTAVTEYEYDAMRRQTLVRLGEAVNGNQPTNVVRTEYDERELVFLEIRGEGDPSQSTTQFDYDGNRNLVRVTRGTEGPAQEVVTTFDAYDRPVSAMDPLGNVTTIQYDPEGNRVLERIDGELVDGPGGASNVRLSETSFTYDALDRLTSETREHFDPASQVAIGDGQSTQQIFYSPRSQVTRVVDDLGREQLFEYDTVNRTSMVTDASGNTQSFTYDGNDNVTGVTTMELSDSGAPAETITTTFVYDALDRKVQRTDNASGVTSFAYDSRGHLTSEVDQRGNVVRNEYDGMGRLVRTIYELTDTGDGGGSLVGTAETLQEWDDSMRLVRLTDPDGNETTQGHDALGRRTSIAYADGTSKSFGYDVRDNIVTVTDPNGSVLTNTYDALDRVTGRAVSPGAGVSTDALAESFQWDGLGRLVAASDEDANLTRSFDSLGNRTLETLNGASVAVTYDSVGNALATSYPGGRTIDRTFDSLNRPSTVSEGGSTIAQYAYLGPLRVEEVDRGNDTRTSYGYDALQRVTSTTWEAGVSGSPTTFDDRAHTWDAVGNKTSTTDLLDLSPSRTYAYDSLSRLVQVDRAMGGLPADSTSYTLTPGGNRAAVSGGPDPGGYVLDATPGSPADAQVNQYTQTPFDFRSYDANGNLVATGTSSGASDLSSSVYDYRNRLVEHVDGGTGERTTYDYDPLGRRIARVADADGAAVETRFVYDGFRVIEEQDGAGSTLVSFVHGVYVDEVLTVRAGGVDHHVHGDSMYSAVAATDMAGAVVERYDYDDFGTPSILDGAGSPIAGSAIGSPYLFAGRRYDTESGLYHLRARMMDPRVGKFTSRDPLGIWADGPNLGNGTAYVANSPVDLVDPFGLASVSVGIEIGCVGAYAGVGASACIEGELETEDCCKDGELIRLGKGTLQLKASAHVGFGIGIKTPIGEAVIKGPGFEFEDSVSISSKCGGGFEEVARCKKFGTNLGVSAGIDLGGWGVEGAGNFKDFLQGCLKVSGSGVTLSLEYCHEANLEAGVSVAKVKLKGKTSGPDCSTIKSISGSF